LVHVRDWRAEGGARDFAHRRDLDPWRGATCGDWLGGTDAWSICDAPQSERLDKKALPSIAVLAMCAAIAFL
jgi:hypothetical protein